MTKTKIIFILTFVFPVVSFSQEIISGLFSNPAIKANISLLKENHSKNIEFDTLPFFDDFSWSDIFPDDSLWDDKNVFINSSYPSMPPSVGVATFDALNSSGDLYNGAGSSTFAADTLTSKPLRLDTTGRKNPQALKVSDSLYFSFFYQPAGIGNAPEPDDSLVLEFYSPSDTAWNHVWSSAGTTLPQFTVNFNPCSNIRFKQVLIPITDSIKYFHRGFRFRFYNYASLANNNYPTWAGNVDQWHIDYVFLNKGRTMADTVYKDVAFACSGQSALKRYYSMPWKQYMADAAGEMRDSFRLSMTNLDTVKYIISARNYEIFNQAGDSVGGFDGYTCQIFPDTDYCLNINQGSCWRNQISPPLGNFVFPATGNDSASFSIVQRLRAGYSDVIPGNNDTITFEQSFCNYYAYDDGIPEAGYGLSPANAMLAYKFNLNLPDTLRAVKMFFNKTLNDASQQYFHLTIWDDANGFPGDTVYQEKNLKPEYNYSLNEFHTYLLKNQSIVLNGTFYVGWKQLTDANLNVGFDMNSDQHSNIFYKTGSAWTNSNFKGALMIRPVFGEALTFDVGINETRYSDGQLKVYPNPSNGETVSVEITGNELPDNSELIISVYDIIGNNIYSGQFTKTLNVSEFPNGIYLLSVSAEDNSVRYYTKLSVVK